MRGTAAPAALIAPSCMTATQGAKLGLSIGGIYSLAVEQLGVAHNQSLAGAGLLVGVAQCFGSTSKSLLSVLQAAQTPEIDGTGLPAVAAHRAGCLGMLCC